MAARKSRHPEAATAEARAFTIVLEEIRAQNKGFGEGQELLRESHELLREEMRAGFAEVDRRFEHVDRRFDRIEQDVGLVKIAVLDHARELKEIRVALGNKVDRHELETLVARGVR
jgi:hypothetical protein